MDRPATINWLLEHRDLWSQGQRAIVSALKNAGLISQKTYVFDVKVEKLILAARIQSGEVKLRTLTKPHHHTCNRCYGWHFCRQPECPHPAFTETCADCISWKGHGPDSDERIM